MSHSHTDRTALVLMKFSGDPWNDPIYQSMCEIVAEAGYQPLRADEIRTSGPVVDEVCRLMRDVPLLLIDTSGDSHSVSYELGYAHGVGRSHDMTVVLRSQASGRIPFNYAHFRLLVYRDRRHLKRSLRSWLNLSTPLREDHVGFALNFSVMPDAGEYGDAVARAVLEALKSLRFSGRCEYYAGEPFVPGESFYVVGLALKTEKGTVPKGEWWDHLAKIVSEALKRLRARLVFNTSLSEIGEVRALRTHYLPRGVVELADGEVVFILADERAEDSWFLGQCRERMAIANKKRRRTKRSTEQP